MYQFRLAVGVRLSSDFSSFMINKHYQLKRCGITLIELLVALAIIGVLTSLTISGVMIARESARNISCIANLKQIGLSLNAYNASFSCFPTSMNGSTAPSGGVQRYPACYSFFTHILYDFDAVVYNNINFSASQPPYSVSIENDTVSRIRISGFLCPSDGVSTRSLAPGCNYRVNMGLGFDSYESSFDAREAGAFALEKWITPAQILDGMSTTAFLSERLKGDGTTLSWDRRRDPWYPLIEYAVNAPPLDRFKQLCYNVSTSDPLHFSESGNYWMLFSFNETAYNHIDSPNSIYPDCSAAGPGLSSFPIADVGLYSARSIHNQTVNILFGDGSARVIRNSIAINVWHSIGTRAGGEIVSGDSF
jgi:prepilin-type N-terminal cleavage/methylation domain-containing protein/prepilin-type processing-associated H-X9-DG protein